MTDGTEIRVERPQDKEVQKMYYSFKKKGHTVKLTIMINKDGLIIYAGVIHQGTTHDIKMLRLDDPDLGTLTDHMKSSQTPYTDKPVNWMDLGYVGAEKVYPGMILMQPIKKAKGLKLTKEEKEYNRQISRIRIKIEHMIGKLKHYATLRNVYIRSDDHLYRDVQIISGLVNHRMLWDKDKKKLRIEV